MLRNMATSLFIHERITTTLAKAKVLRSYAERLITRAKQDTLHARRLVARDVQDKKVLTKLFSSLAPRYGARPGGYTRIYKLGLRKGDAAELAVVELVGRKTGAAEPSTGGAARKRAIERDEPDADTTGDAGDADDKRGD